MRYLTALLLVSLFTGCGSSSDSNIAQDALRARVDTLENRLQKAQARVETLRESRSGTTLEVLPVDIFFQPGSASLSPQGTARLDSLAELIKGRYEKRQIRVEGYADNLPLSNELKERYTGNWELSAARAAAVVRYFQWGHEIEPSRFEVVGMGSFQPIAPNDSRESRSQNRRVRVAVLPQEDGA